MRQHGLCLAAAVAMLAGCSPTDSMYTYKNPHASSTPLTYGRLSRHESYRPSDARPADASPADVRPADDARSADLAAGPVAPEHSWAVVIGLDSYKDARIPALRTAEADASAVAKLLTTRARIPADNVKLIVGQEATQQNIRSALGTWLARKAMKHDLVMIFYAGHGAPETDYSKKSPDGMAKYIVPYDAKADDLYATGIPMREVADVFDRIEAERIVFISDACFSGAAGGRSFAIGQFRGVQLGDPTAELKGKGRAIITAGDANEPAVEDKDLGHGVFTYYLLEGLSGKAAESDGSVTLGGLYKYVSDKVTRKSKELGGNQHPVMKGEVQGDIVIVPPAKPSSQAAP